MVHGWEELGDIQGEHGSVKAAISVAGDNVHEDDANICSSVLADPSELTWVEKVMGDSVKLKVLGEDLGEKLAQSVEERDGAEGFWQIVPVLLGFGDDNGVRCLELGQPYSAVEDAVENVS